MRVAGAPTRGDFNNSVGSQDGPMGCSETSDGQNLRISESTDDPSGRGSQIANGKVDQHLRNPSCCILSHTQVMISKGLVPSKKNPKFSKILAIERELSMPCLLGFALLCFALLCFALLACLLCKQNMHSLGPFFFSAKPQGFNLKNLKMSSPGLQACPSCGGGKQDTL